MFSSAVQKLTPLRMPMAATPPSQPRPAGDDRNLVPVTEATALSFEDKVSVFWQKNRTLVVAACVAVVIAILAKGGWEYLARQRELDVQRAYAAAKTPEQLKAFAESHPGHELGAIAQLRIADDAYKAGKGAESVAAYEKAVNALEGGPLAARAQVGRAMAKVLAGKTAEATNELKQLSGDPKQLKAVRAEVTYHLASLAAESGNSAEVQKLSEQLMQIDPSSPWASRAMALRATLPAPAPASAAPAASAKAPAAGDQGAKVELKLPGKKD